MDSQDQEKIHQLAKIMGWREDGVAAGWKDGHGRYISRNWNPFENADHDYWVLNYVHSLRTYDSVTPITFAAKLQSRLSDREGYYNPTSCTILLHYQPGDYADTLLECVRDVGDRVIKEGESGT